MAIVHLEIRYDLSPKIHHNNHIYGFLAQLGEHLLDVQKVTGSSPVEITVWSRAPLMRALRITPRRTRNGC